MRKALFIAPLTALVLCGFATDASAQGSATATAGFAVTEINEVRVSGDPVQLTIGSKAAIDDGVTDASTTWGVTTNAASDFPMKITGVLSTPMPDEVELYVSLAAPASSGVAAGSVKLSTTPADLVSGLSQLNEDNLVVTYRLTATQFAAVVSDSREVLYTIVTGY